MFYPHELIENESWVCDLSQLPLKHCSWRRRVNGEDHGVCSQPHGCRLQAALVASEHRILEETGFNAYIYCLQFEECQRTELQPDIWSMWLKRWSWNCCIKEKAWCSALMNSSRMRVEYETSLNFLWILKPYSATAIEWGIVLLLRFLYCAWS